MRAVVVERYGDPSVLVLKQDYPKPARGPSELLVRIHATSVNPVDTKIRQGHLRWAGGVKPKVLGGDVAGVVEEADPGSRFKPGDKVWGLVAGYRWSVKWGTYADYVSAPEAHFAPMPESLSYEEAAALPLVALTAWQALDTVRLEPGQGRVLVHAGSGGVGSMAVQLAKARGLHVTTTCSARNADLVNELGADVVIDYQNTRFEDAPSLKEHPVDLVIDTIGGAYQDRSMRVLNRSGQFVSLMASGSLYLAIKGRVLAALRLAPAFRVLMVEESGRQLADIGKLVDEGKVKPIIDSGLPLEQASEAHAKVESGHARGKVVLRVA